MKHEKMMHIDKFLRKNIFSYSKPPGSNIWDMIDEMGDSFKKNFIKKFSNGPETIFLILTTKCNQNCEFCNINKIGIPKDTKTILNKIYEIIGPETKYVIINGGNPFMEKEILDIIRKLLEKVRVSITTPSGLPFEVLEKLKRAGITKIQFYIDSTLFDDKSQKNSDYMKNIIKTIENCNKIDLYTAVIANVNKNTVKYLPSIIKLCEKLKVGQFSFFRFPACGIVCDNYSNYFVKNEEYAKVNEFLIKKRQKSSIHITSNDAMWKGCSAALTSCTIFPNGDVCPCAFLPIICGNILKENLSKIWESELFVKLRERNLTGKCGRCKYKLLCGGCRGVAFYHNKDPLGEDPGCWLR